MAEPNRRIAITMDDLPFVGEQKNYHLNLIIETAKAEEIPLTGFVIAKEVEKKNWEMLQKFKEAGLELGSHTYSHANLNRVSTERYLQEIESADTILRPVMTKPKYFRYPYLATGSGSKRDTVLDFLAEKHYRVAPITIDSKDFIFNQLLLSTPEASRRSFMETLKPCYLNFIWQQTQRAEEHNRSIHREDQAQILLIHSNLLNAYSLADIVKLYRQNGYKIISLKAALNSFNPHKKSQLVKAKLKPLFDTDFFAWD